MSSRRRRQISHFPKRGFCRLREGVSFWRDTGYDLLSKLVLRSGFSITGALLPRLLVLDAEDAAILEYDLDEVSTYSLAATLGNGATGIDSTDMISILGKILYFSVSAHCNLRVGSASHSARRVRRRAGRRAMRHTSRSPSRSRTCIKILANRFKSVSLKWCFLR